MHTQTTPLRDSALEGVSFGAYAKRVRVELEAELERWLDQERSLARALHPEAGVVVDAMSELCTRGGKRFRAVLVAASYEACGGEGGSTQVVWAGVAMEVLQAYLLIHDDWMDGDELRRGGPSVHARLRRELGGTQEGDAAAILAGDFASALALEALTRVRCAPARIADAFRELARMEHDVVLGQILDVRGASDRPEAVEAMHDLKTSSYTVRGPLLLGAALAGASQEQRAALERAAAPLGVAFQLRDDLLGAFGDPEKTGKPRGGDLRQGKRNSLVVEAGRDSKAKAEIATVLGRVTATNAEIDVAIAALVACGARATVEARLEALLEQARSLLAQAPLSAGGALILAGAVDALGVREV